MNIIFQNCIHQPVLLLGVGNYLMGDEGLGVHIAMNLAGDKLPPGVEVLDGGTAGFHLMGIMEQYELIILIDATLDGQPAGTVRWLAPKFASDFPRSMSTHDIGLRDVLEALQVTGRLPKIQLITISVEELQPMTIGLSTPVQDAATRVQDDIYNMLWEWHNFENRGVVPSSLLT